MFKVVNNGKLPTRATKYSCAVDLYANDDVTIGAGETKMIGLGVKIDIDKFVSDNQSMFMEQDSMFAFDSVPEYTFSDRSFMEFKKSHYLQLAPRSSLRAKGLISGQGYIDLDYPDEIKMIVHNPIQYIDKEVDFCLDEDYIELDYLGSPNEIEGFDIKYSSSYQIKKGDRIGQIVLLEHKSYLFGIESEDERNGGIGSTDV